MAPIAHGLAVRHSLKAEERRALPAGGAVCPAAELAASSLGPSRGGGGCVITFHFIAVAVGFIGESVSRVT